MSRKKKFFSRQIGLLFAVVWLDVSLNLLLTPADHVNGIIKESLISGLLAGTVFAFIADRIDVHYREKET